jgi:hypothetical protein
MKKVATIHDNGQTCDLYWGNGRIYVDEENYFLSTETRCKLSEVETTIRAAWGSGWVIEFVD